MKHMFVKEKNMILDISNELMDTGRSKQYTVSYESDTFSYRDGDFRVVSSEPFELRIVSPAKNKIHITGSGSIILAIPCSRCLEDVNTVIPFDIDEEVSVDADDNDEEQYFIESHYVDTDKMLYTEILLSMPPKVLCKEDCKGICTVCGHNLNDGECGCDRFVPDTRMSAINDIFEQFSKNS